MSRIFFFFCFTGNPQYCMNSPYFCFAAWKRIGKGVIKQFNVSISINVPYDDSALAPSQEQKIRIFMYNPAIQAWVKLGGKVDTSNNMVTGLLSSITPYEEDGNALFALAVDGTPDLEQRIDQAGKTILSSPDREDVRFEVLHGTVEVGSHFEVTNFTSTPPSNSSQLLMPPVDIQAYHVNHDSDNYTDHYQITDFSKPISIEFDYDPDTLAQAGGKTNLTIVMLQNDQWNDMEELGYQVTRHGNKIIVETNKPGCFSLAIKQ